VTTFDSEPAATTTRSAASILGGAADTRAHQHERRHKQLRASLTATVHKSMLEQSSRELLVVTAQLVEAACRARVGDSHGTRAHIARAVALLDGHSGPRVTRQTSDRGPRQIPRGGFAAWQSRRLAAHVDANLAGKIVIKELAASLDISVGHFCRAFKHTFGMPARIWIRHRRIELAQGLMLTTGASLSEIALKRFDGWDAAPQQLRLAHRKSEAIGTRMIRRSIASSVSLGRASQASTCKLRAVPDRHHSQKCSQLLVNSR
jgi:AraC-like DNA-binding protein